MGFLARIRAFISKLRAKRGLNWAVILLAALVMSFVWQAGIELIRGQSVTGFLEYLWLRRRNWLPGYLVMLSSYLFLTGVFARAWVGNLVVGATSLAAGFANYYKLFYRENPALPRDLVQLGEATQIAAGMETPLTREMVWLLVLLILSTLALLPFRLPLGAGWKKMMLRGGVSAAGFGLCLGLALNFAARYDLMKGVTASNTADKFDVDYTTYYFYGTFVSSFFHFLPDYLESIPQAPEGYSQQAMADLTRELEGLPAGTHSPDIIVILSESFYDLHAIQGTCYAEDLTPNFDRIAEAGSAGTMLSPMLGGGTAWVEYMVLTGFGGEGVPTGSVPYIEFMRADYPSFPQYFSAAGYQTLAIHPHWASYYHRDTAFGAMGFDRFISYEDFPKVEDYDNHHRDYTDDEVLARRIISEYEAMAASDGAPVFLQGISMQNHAPYDEGVYGADYRVAAESGQEAEYDAVLSTLATGIRDADAMLGMLVDYFATVDREVLLLFYGDHQVTVAASGGGNLVTRTEAYQSATPQEQWVTTHSTPYLMWGNYDAAPETAEYPVLAPNLLLPVLLQRYDVACAPWQSWLARSAETLAGEVGGYYIAPDGGITHHPSEAMAGVYRTAQWFQYDLMFGKEYARAALYG